MPEKRFSRSFYKMKRKGPNWRVGQLDWYTSDTLVKMTKYINDDTKIARHLGIKVDQVKLARSRLMHGHSKNIDRNVL